MEFGLYESTIFILCILSYVGIAVFCLASPFLHERKLKKVEVAAELAILSEKLCQRKKLEESHL